MVHEAHTLDHEFSFHITIALRLLIGHSLAKVVTEQALSFIVIIE